jgi:hypothetical protein
VVVAHLEVVEDLDEADTVLLGVAIVVDFADEAEVAMRLIEGCRRHQRL